MASVLDVARYVVSELNPITTMKLQKLVYYSQAWSLVWDEAPLFDDDFEAWANGPVCRTLYRYHRGLFVLGEDFLSDTVKEDRLTTEQKETIDSVLMFYGDKTPQWLSDLTHQERPWKETRGKLSPGEPSEEVIPKELMQQYYGGLI